MTKKVNSIIGFILVYSIDKYGSLTNERQDQANVFSFTIKCICDFARDFHWSTNRKKTMQDFPYFINYRRPTFYQKKNKLSAFWFLKAGKNKF